MDLITASSSNSATAARSSPLANAQSTSPHLPNHLRRFAGSTAASLPMVVICRDASLRLVAGPTYSRSEAGRGHAISL